MNAGESPPVLFDRALRRRRAERSAASFPDHDVLHGYAADLVAERLLDVSRSFSRACVWGDRGRHIETRLPAGKIASAIHAGAFACAATNVAADVEQSPFAGDAFDLVVSLLDLHAVNDPIGALVQMGQSLKPDGLFIGVMFGAETLNELRTVFGEAEIELEGGLSPRVFPFADVRDAGGLLQRAGLALPVAEADRLTIRYSDPMRLLADLRGAGETNILTARRRRFLGRETLLRALGLYGERLAGEDGKIPATFSFVTMTGWKPHDSQQKPLKPGSARMRLADALGSQAGKPPVST